MPQAGDGVEEELQPPAPPSGQIADDGRRPMHIGQLTVPLQTVRALVAEQFPKWAGHAVSPVRSDGTVNAIFRIGDSLAARFPLVPDNPAELAATQRAEAEAMAELVGRTRFPTPEPVGQGEPGHGYPLPWTVQTWLPGVTADVADPGGSAEFACDLAEFIAGVRTIDTRGRTFSGGGRGGNLQAHDDWVGTCLHKSRTLLDVSRVRTLWARLRHLPRTAPDLMVHGDIMPGNVLVAGARVVGVIDCGGLGPADPALDLVSAWHLLAAGPRQTFRTRLDVDDLEWERGKAWALEQALGLVWYYTETNEAMSRTGKRTIDRLLADDGATG